MGLLTDMICASVQRGVMIGRDLARYLCLRSI